MGAGVWGPDMRAGLRKEINKLLGRRMSNTDVWKTDILKNSIF